jgi:hypothetical protein
MPEILQYILSILLLIAILIAGSVTFHFISKYRNKK